MTCAQVHYMRVVRALCGCNGHAHPHYVVYYHHTLSLRAQPH